MKSWMEKLPKYEPVRDSEEDSDSSQGSTSTTNHHGSLRIITYVTIFVLFQLFAFFGFAFIGYTFGANRPESGHQIHVQNAYPAKAHGIDTASIRTQTLAFSFNHTFAERPGAESDAAWESIFPPHGGFFHDEEMAPKGASLAAYHQLHCLDGIRHAYYLLLDAVIEGRNVTFSEVPEYSTDWHTRHCLDFLRQMLMCNADLTIENVSPELGGILGSGQQHECVVWQDVKDWSIAHQKDEKIL